MKTALKLLLAFLALALLGLGILWVSITRLWPWWVGTGIFLGILGLAALALALAHHARRRRERRFVQRVVSEDTAAIGNAPIQERQALQDLQDRWMEAIGQLRHSFLRTRGNPLYVLPWYLVIGESGAGKTSAIARSGLSSILGERRRGGPIASTRNCDWWFFEQAIVLDTAGRYTIPIDETLDREEWKRFLTLLARYRRREPINGVVVVVPADQLLACDGPKLREDALDIRRRLDHVMRSLGTKAPVYLLVTKMDKVLGMTAFARALGPRAAQAMGYTNEAKEPGWEGVLDRTLETVGRRLAELRFDLVREDPEAGPGLLLFPTEFAKLRAGLALFLGSLFQETAYLETPLLRGVHFSSAAPGGQPESAFLKAYGLREAPAPAAQEGFFLKAFFSTILPRDRHLHRPIREFLEWSRVRRNLAFLAWSFLWLGALGLMGAAFTQNLTALNAFSAHWRNLPVITGDVAQDLLAVDQVRMDVSTMKRINRNWWIPRFGLDQSLRAERVAQGAWVKVFRQGLLEPTDLAARRVADLDRRSKDAYAGPYAGFLVTRVALLQGALENRNLRVDQEPAILGAFTRASTDLLLHLHPDLAPEVAERYGPNYFADIVWNDNVAARRQKLGDLRWELARLLARDDVDLRWMLDSWIPDAAEVPLAEFWGEAEQPLEDGAAIPGAYTREGRKHLKAFTTLLEATLPGDRSAAAKVAAFWEGYQQPCDNAWLGFARRFREGAQGAVTPLGRQRLATLMTTRENPYFRLLERMAQEVGSPEGGTPAPWALLLGRLSRARELADQQLAEKSNASTLDKLDLERRKQLRTWEGRLDASKAKALDLSLAASKSWMEYVAGLQEITPNLLSRANARRQMLACFGGGEGDEAPGGASPFLKAQGSILALEVLLGSDSSSRTVWDLVRGPLDHAMAYCLDETANVLQDLWEQNVVSATREKDPGQLHRLLFSPAEGRVWAFVKGPAKPFVVKSETGYAARRAFGQHTLPFTAGFFGFLKASEDGDLTYQQRFPITLETLPLEVNPGALVTPIGSKLTLQTPEKGRDSLENYNFSQKAIFNWEPETSGEASLQILLPSLTLTRTWPGPSGFAHFLEELETGSRAYGPRDFPEVEDKLRALGITWIRVAYKVQGSDPALRHFRRAPTAVPRVIVATEAAE
ncbi:type VI secretion protein IcmF/TssM N-terminal domain-containing protein [Mesoterricola silvestris]|uniref:Type VI secretion system protein ImpL n=1 Tax=Mesoterricola silvestris TaxID=2927979 RepID=A0AA48GLQ6_9BACT|nr:type VI secretion protein IcmF/TssM N-terminal domain-containing protein [Mesoterricola silvestris]BDU73722.1 type VI secretion system protein ImpL [Mesoterricola silvestris]